MIKVAVLKQNYKMRDAAISEMKTVNTGNSQQVRTPFWKHNISGCKFFIRTVKENKLVLNFRESGECFNRAKGFCLIRNTSVHEL